MKDIPNKVVIIGIGLIGGSIALGLKKVLREGIEIVGLNSNPNRSRNAKKRGIIDSIIDFEEIKKVKAKLIILAAPININIKLLSQLKNICRPDTLIIDVSSTKEVICKVADDVLPNDVFFLGTHPMGGKETSGFASVSVDLFNHKPWIICPTAKSRTEDIKLIKKLTKIFNARPVVLDPSIHDRITAQISHLPSLIASGLINNSFGKKNKKINLSIASAGFADTTRLASQDPKMIRDIVQTNNNNILVSLKLFGIQLRKLEEIILTKNNLQLMNYLTLAKRTRDTWIKTQI